MPPSGSSNNPESLHQTNSNPSTPLLSSHSSHTTSTNHANPSQKKSSKPNRTKPHGSSYVTKKKSKKKSSTNGHLEANSAQLRSTSSHQSITTSVAAHVLDQALENSLRNQRQKNRRRPHAYLQSQQRKEIDNGKEDNVDQSERASPFKAPSNELSKKTQRKQHKHRKATNSSSSIDASVDSKRSPLKGSYPQAKANNMNLASINEEKDNSSMKSNNSAKSAVASSSTRRRHNRSKNKANISGDSSSTYSTKVNNLTFSKNLDLGTRTANQILTEGVQVSRSSGSKCNESKEGHLKKKKYHYVNKVSNAASKQSNEFSSKKNISHDLPHHNPVLPSSSNDLVNSNSLKDDAHQQPRRSRFFQKKATHCAMGHNRKKAVQSNSEDGQINPKVGPQHSQTQLPKQNLEEKSKNAKDNNHTRNKPQSQIEAQESENKFSSTGSDQSTKSKQRKAKKVHEPNLDFSKESSKQSIEENSAVIGLGTKLEELRIEEVSAANLTMSQTENAPTSRIKRSDSNHSTLSSMENNTTITMTTTATDMTASLGDNNRPSRMMMAPNFYGNYNRGNYDEFYPYQPESYPNPQTTCMLPPNPTFNDPSMIPFGIQMSYPMPYQYPMSATIPFIPPQEYNNFPPNQDPNNYGPTPTDDRNDIMVPPSNQMSDNSVDASYRVPFYPNESENQQYPPFYKEITENRGESGVRNPGTSAIPNMPMLPPQIPFSGGMHPHFFGMNYQPPPQPVFMEHLLNYQPHAGISQSPQLISGYSQNLISDSFVESKEEVSEGTKTLNADGAGLELNDQNQNSCSKQ